MSGGAVADRQSWTRDDWRAYLKEYAQRCRDELAKQDASDAARAWGQLPLHQRTLLLMLAGVDGDLDALALRPWAAMPPPERDAVFSAIRGQVLAWRGFLRVCGVPRGVA